MNASIEERVSVSYKTFRNGFGEGVINIPSWNDAPPWVRDVAIVAYLQGTLDGRSPAFSQASREGEA